MCLVERGADVSKERAVSLISASFVFALKVYSSRTREWLSLYRTARYHVSYDNYPHIHRRRDLRPYIGKVFPLQARFGLEGG